ncbi:MAG: hypothetical protein HLUCCA08_01815 [Rhodobacteraceae bacterium HLUCCA08]|nr:MAG: hypothetical protein HLUCCA08_01815 [Rhodobacteraceae bacterium HLUCCA08]
MKPVSFAALVAVAGLSACTGPEIPGRMDSGRILAPGPVYEEYVPQVVGARSANDVMRFSTMSLVQ